MFPPWLSRVFGKLTQPSRRQRRAARRALRPTFRPRLEILEDRMLPSATLPISVDPTGTTMGNASSSTAPNQVNTNEAISANGQYEVFVSGATDLVNGVTIPPFSGFHVYLRNLSAGTTTLVDVATNGTEASNDGANNAALSPDGRYVAFVSGSNDLTNNDANVPAAQVYVRDMQTGQTYLVSLGIDGKPQNGGPYESPTPSIAEDSNGHLLIAYQSKATNLTSGDSNSKQYQIFLAKLNLDSSGNIQYGSLSTTLVSADKNGNGAGTGIGQGGDSFDPMLSKDGSTLAFRSYATNLNVPGGYNDNSPGVANLYLYSVANQTLKLLSAEPTTGTNATGNAPSYLAYSSFSSDLFDSVNQQATSANGQYVVFTSSADNLVPGLPTYGFNNNVYRRDLVNGTTSLVSISSDGTSGVTPSDGANDPVITPDGRYVAFLSNARNLTSKNGGMQVYVRDMQQGQTYLVSLGTDGNAANNGVLGGRLPGIAETSASQLVISYYSSSTNLTANDTNSSKIQVFVTTFNLDVNGNIEYNTLATKLASADSSGNGGDGDSEDAILSRDGSTLAFESFADNLTGETPDNADGSQHTQVFTYNVTSGKLTQVSPTPPSGDIANSSKLSSISDNGQYLVYVYSFTPVNQNSWVNEVLAWDANAGTNTQIATSNGAAFGNFTQPVISGDGSTIAFRGGNALGQAVIYAARNWQSGGTATQISPSPHSPTPGDSSTTVFSAEEPSISDNGQIIAYQINPYEPKPAQLYVYNFNDGTTTEISAAVGGGNSNGAALTPEVSADGSTVVFNSSASDLVSGVANFTADKANPQNVFAYNVASKTVSLASAKAPGVFTVDADILSPTISDNGRYIAYYTSANDLLGGLPNAPTSVIAEDVQQGVPTVITTDSFAQISSPVISGDGSTVAFNDNAQLTSIKTNGGQIYSATNWQSGSPTITLVSVGIDNNPNNGGANGSVGNASISDNGQVVAFESHATNLTNNSADASTYRQIFVRNLKTSTTTLASANSAGTNGGNNGADTPVVSSDGSMVIYNSFATDLVSGVNVATDSNGNPIVPNVYAYLSNPSAPVIIGNPSNQTVTAGQTTTFTATASGSPVPTIQWQVSTDGGATFTNLTGATSTTLTLSNVTAAMNGDEYRAVFSNTFGTATTTAATLTVAQSPPPPAPPPSPPPVPPAPPVIQPPPLLAFFNSLFGATETVNADGSVTETASFFGIPLLISTFDPSGHLESVYLLGINVTLLFELL